MASFAEAIEGSLADVGAAMFLIAMSAIFGYGIFLPLIRELDGDPVHFGLVFIIAVTIGNFTPPVGSAMHAVCSILKCPIGKYSRESVPFLVAVTLVTLILIFIPAVVLFVPNLLFGAY